MKISRIFLALVGITAFAGSSQAQSATQTVTYSVSAINEVSVSGTPTLTVSTATAGSAPNAVSSSGLTWSITTNEDTKKVTAVLDSAMVSGVTLTVNLVAPTGATSAGAVTLSTTAVNAVTGISRKEGSGLGLTYTLSATTAAGVVSSRSRTVTYTIAAGV